MVDDGAGLMEANLAEVRALLLDMLELMQSTSITAMPESSEAYVDMIESMGVLVKQFEAVAQHLPKEAFQDEEILLLSTQIRGLHQRQTGLAIGIVRELKKSLKDIRTEKNISYMYGEKGYSSGAFFSQDF